MDQDGANSAQATSVAHDILRDQASRAILTREWEGANLEIQDNWAKRHTLN